MSINWNRFHIVHHIALSFTMPHFVHRNKCKPFIKHFFFLNFYNRFKRSQAQYQQKKKNNPLSQQIRKKNIVTKITLFAPHHAQWIPIQISDDLFYLYNLHAHDHSTLSKLLSNRVPVEEEEKRRDQVVVRWRNIACLGRSLFFTDHTQQFSQFYFLLIFF